MKRFFIKSVAYLSIAFLLAAFLPNGFGYTKVLAQTAGPGAMFTPPVNYENARVITNENKTSALEIANKPSSSWTEDDRSKLRDTGAQINMGYYSGNWTDIEKKKVLESAYEAGLPKPEPESKFAISGKPIEGWPASQIVTGINWILYAIQSAVGWVLGWVSKAVDTSISYSKGLANEDKIIEAIKKNWTVFRDTFNLFFIFILLYISIQTILKGAAAKTKEMLANVVIAALLINFSLLITNVIIDTSNIFTLAIYEKGESITGETASVTTQIMQSLKLQSMEDITKDENGKEVLATASLGLTLVLVLKIILTSVVLWAFCKVFVLMITRLVVFLVLMALSPIGFVGSVIPKVGEYSSKWWKALSDQSLVGPVFAFLITVAATAMKAFSNSDILLTIQKAGETGQDTGAMVGLVFNLAICVGLIITAVNVTKKFSGDAGAFATSLGSKMLGGVAGLAVGGVGGFAMRNLVGRGAAALANSEKFKAAAAGNGIGGVVGRLALRGVNNTSKATFDVRNTDLAKTVNKKLGLDLGKAGGKGGFDQQVKDYAKRSEDMGKLLERDMGSDLSKEMVALKKQEKAAKKMAGNKDLADKVNNDAGVVSDTKALEGAKSEKMSLDKQMVSITAQLKNAGSAAETQKIKTAQAETMAKIKAKEKEIVEKEKARGEKIAKLVLTKEESSEIEGDIKSEHQKDYADVVQKSMLTRWAAGEKGRRASAKKVRDLFKSKSTDQQAKELLEKIQKEKDGDKTKEDKPAEEKPKDK